MRLMNPKITKTHKEHAIFEDMLLLVNMRAPRKEEDSVNRGAQESQSLRNNAESEEEIKDSVDEEEGKEVPRESEEVEEKASNEGSSCDSSDIIFAMPKRSKRILKIQLLSKDEEEEKIAKKRRIEDIR